MNKRIKKNIISITCFVAIFVVLFVAVSTCVRVTDNITIVNIKGIENEKKNSLDVALIGASEVYSGFSPTQAWKNYGYTSYSLGVSGVPGILYKSMLQKVLKNQNPSVVVVEINGFMQGDEYMQREGRLHQWLDNIKWDDDRQATIDEIIPKDKQKDYVNMFTTYHDNWKNPVKCVKSLYVRGKLSLKTKYDMKGFATISGTDVNKEYKEKDKKYKLTKKSKAALQDLIDYCKGENLENVIFVRFPHSKEVKDTKSIEDVKKLVEDNGYDFLDLDSKKSEMNIKTGDDFYNADHLNVYGMEKLTQYFGDYIRDNYEISKKKPAELTKDWDESAKRADIMIKKAKKETDLNTHKRIYELSN